MQQGREKREEGRREGGRKENKQRAEKRVRTGNFARLRGERGGKERENRREGRQEFSSSRKNAHYVHAPLQLPLPPPSLSLRSSFSTWRRLGVGEIPNFRRRFFHCAPVVPARRPSTSRRKTCMHAARRTMKLHSSWRIVERFEAN